MSIIKDKRFTRRGFMKAGGALVVMAGVPLELAETAARAIAAGAFYATPNPAALASWLTINANGTVVARSGHVELGHGVQTGLAQIVAEELDVPISSVSMVLGNTDVTPDQGGTFGSQSIKVAGTQLRQIAAEGRAALLALASTRLGAPVSQLAVKNGVVSNGSQTVSY
ncbi:MAG TPA: molybdopterin cofactor-binding domain-containing protein, partial [Candidatus Dormibacteraeota bacterium]|nr:molybdopterin cofactor-binding domain-containing protein [Candidatus Dormibacteraeota bacterium]